MPAVTELLQYRTNKWTKKAEPHSEHTSCIHPHLDLHRHQWRSAWSLRNVKGIRHKCLEECCTQQKTIENASLKYFYTLQSVFTVLKALWQTTSPLNGGNETQEQSNAIQVSERRVQGGHRSTVRQQWREQPGWLEKCSPQLELGTPR